MATEKSPLTSEQKLLFTMESGRILEVQGDDDTVRFALTVPQEGHRFFYLSADEAYQLEQFLVFWSNQRKGRK